MTSSRSTPGCVSIYLCGATVQAAPHIGHIRSGLNFDIMRRWFTYRGYEVTFVRNVTDIDDKIIVKAAEQGRPWWAIGYENERAFNAAYDALGCLPPTYEPRATGHIPEMIEMMRALIDRGHAYAADGNVYFDVRSYDRLSRALQPGAGQPPPARGRGRDRQARPARLRDVEGRQARRAELGDALGPAAAPAGTWSAPPWRTSTSAPPSTSTAAASTWSSRTTRTRSPSPRPTATSSPRYWAHNAWVTMSGEKMSKSLGNSVLVSEMVKHWRPIVLRYYLGGPHYRSTIEYSEESLREAEAAFGRIEGFLQRAGETRRRRARPRRDVPAAFAEAMDDDFGVPQALAVVHTTVRQGNAALSEDDKERRRDRLRGGPGHARRPRPRPARRRAGSPRAPMPVGGDELHDVVDSLVRLVLDQRQAARARKDYATADAIRDELKQAGLVIEDTPSGPRWELGGGAGQH